ncbi:unnamed protein product [Thlaspi arvense]|uniref:BED-type domain-containing protein n=1 Tax=Thlaspi arvense TaxID=13288 RepID=A0AAU9RZ84_THLAR|nr:unnamed protein product [Thlaspi arvense]
MARTRTMETALEVYNEVEMGSPEAETQPPIKRRKKKSKVWENFTIKNTEPGCRRAVCNGCNQSFAYSSGTKVAGTSHLKRHIDKGTCPALLIMTCWFLSAAESYYSVASP